MMLNRCASAMITAAGLLAVSSGVCGAAEVRLIAAIPLAAVLRDLGSTFERETGHKLAMQFVSGPVVKREIDAGRQFDAALSITPVIDALVKERKIDAATRVDVAYAGIGVGVSAGAPVPDISTVDAFSRTLLAARSVAHSAEGASGAYFKALLDKLGIAEAMKPKLRPMPADRIAQAVPDGEAEMIVVTMSVIVGSGARLVGPVPAELQFYNAFAGGVANSAGAKEPALAFIRFVTAPAAREVFRSHGLEVGSPPRP